jgi:hypothetical protein
MIRKEIGLEQFYTPQATADWVVQVCRDQPWWIDIVEAIEPTAGKGVFVNALKPYDHYMTVHAGDLEPKHPDVVQWDALTVDVEKLLWFEKKGMPIPIDHVLLIGNPPFGRQSALARQIWDVHAPYVGYTAFIVPRSMAIPKFMTKSRSIPKCHDLLFTLSLPSDKFELPDGKTKSIKGVALLVTRHQALRDQKANPVSIRGDDWKQYV